MIVKFNNSLTLHFIRQDLWELAHDFVFTVIDKDDKKIFYAMSGFRTDLASVPRMPFAYLLAGGIGAKAAVAHDYLYSISHVTKEYADNVFLEALKECGVSWYRRYPMYWAVKLFGNKNV